MSDRVRGGAGPQTANTAMMASISCVTFNHVNYIRIALDNFLMQKTDFAFETLVHDNASTDGTSNIIREYAARYPEKMKPLIQTENQYSQGIDDISGTFNFPGTGGKYIFTCDSDNYLLSPGKLQRQMSYMETHPDCTLCIHSANIDLMGKALTEDQIRPYKKSCVLSPKEIIDKPSGYAISSMAFPVHLVRDLPDCYVDCPVGDTPIQLIAAANGYGYYFDETMNAYRVGVVGPWTMEGKNGDYQDRQRAYCNRMRRTYEQFDRAIGERFRKTAENTARRIYYQTMVNTEQFKEIFNPQCRKCCKGPTPRMRFFLRFEHTMPAVYEVTRKAFIGK